MNTLTFGLGYASSNTFNGFDGQGALDALHGTPSEYRAALMSAGWGDIIVKSVPDDIGVGEYPLYNGLRIQVR